MGYEQQLSRGIRGWFMSACFGFVAIGTVPYTGLDIDLQTGGAITAIVSWIATSVFSFLVACSLGELCSAFPNSGGAYHWTGQLAPSRWAPFASFVVGVLLLFGNTLATVTTAANTAQWIGSSAASSGIVIPEGGLIGVAMAVACAWAAINILRIRTLARFVVACAAWEIFTGVVVAAVLYASIAPVRATLLWTEWENTTGFSDGYATLLGMQHFSALPPHLCLIRHITHVQASR